MQTNVDPLIVLLQVNSGRTTAEMASALGVSEADVKQRIAAAEKELGQDGRVLVRYSGTQNLCRVMVEGPTDETVARLCESIAAALKKEIG